MSAAPDRTRSGLRQRCDTFGKRPHSEGDPGVGTDSIATTEQWVIADIKSIQQVIFESNRLAQMRGGSQLLRSLDEKVISLAQQIEAQVEIAAGGQYRLRLPSVGSARSAIAELRRLVTDHTGLPGHRLVAVSHPVVPPSERHEAYAALARSQPDDVQLASPDCGLIRPCESCRRRVGISAHARTGGLLCGVCERREREARSGLQGLWKELELEGYETSDLSAFSWQARPSNYVAVIVADGDGIGARLRSAPDDVPFSKALHAATSSACWEVVSECENKLLPQWIGGDDVVLVTLPQYAVGAATALARTFSTELHNSLAGLGTDEAPLTMSVGVAIAHASLPMHQFVRLGEDLLRRAKAARRRGQFEFPDPVGLVDFEIVTEAMSADLDQRRRSRPIEPLPVYHDPNTPGGLDNLWALAKRLHDLEISRNALRRFVAGEENHGLPLDKYTASELNHVREFREELQLEALYYLRGRA